MASPASDFDPLRRLLLKASSASVGLGGLLATGLLQPSRVLAADWNRPAFTATSLTEAIKAASVTGSVESGSIVIKTVEIAENGAQVPLEVISNLPDSQNISIFVEKNPMPLAASLNFGKAALARVRLQLKMAESSRIRVVVRAADGKTYHASREVKVTIGGCGG
ncbi:MAG: thiosulfate oxidation carrier protein SoxY [Candidatus Accumulibacter sp.]|jgi:sulfur-oxidizing protein SoxY|uniref:thiosulfate oxidation carrier protein SoxY n=1 Tax=Accumulibacter sp. TaxID=2053492 RepID=UPI001A479A78|nr:thiosulfate oxidation carrier protein SoxY [Accumulibacter sp.]MBL8395214.1 thiosulfate oxidation carrier protein SoxY [Accumulibacter sp.]